MKELLISVTNFFRDADGVAGARAAHHPAAVQQQGRAPIRCGSGSPDARPARRRTRSRCCWPSTSANPLDRPAIQVFATDLDERAIAIAPRRAATRTAEVADVSEERLQRFFVRDAGRLPRAPRAARAWCCSRITTSIKDPPFSHLDLISCRNLLIYLNRAVQERVIETFHFALRPGGYLFLGTSESPEGVERAVHARRQARRTSTRAARSRSRLAVPLVDGAPTDDCRARAHAPRRARAERVSPADLHQRLLEQYAPPSLVVTEDHHVVHMSERAGRYLQIRGGEPSRDLLQLVHPELRPRSAHRAAPGRARSHQRRRARRRRAAGERHRAGSTSRSGRCCATATRRAASSWCCSTRRDRREPARRTLTCS